MKITYFVHSITKDNEQGIATGWLDSELSAEGIRRAQSVRNQLSGKKYDAIYASDLRRAVQSAHIFFGQNQKIITDPRLRECNYGTLDGTPAKDFKKGREQNYITHPYPGGESYRDVESRMKKFLVDMHAQYPDGSIAIVSHQAPQLALEVLLQGKSWEEAVATDWRKTQAWQLGWEYDFNA